MIISIVITVISLILLCMFVRDITPVIITRIIDHKIYKRMEEDE